MKITFTDVDLVVENNEVLKNISLRIRDGLFTSIIGPNGAGKSSILRIIVKDIVDYSGFVTDVSQEDVTYLPQDLYPPPFLRINEILSLAFLGQKLSSLQEEEILDDLLTLCGIDHLRDRVLDDVSVGERQRVWLAFALAQDKDLILIDEPLSAVDVFSRKDFFNLLKDTINRGKTLVVVTHDVDMAVQYSDYLIVLRDGEKLYEGDPAHFQDAILGF